MELHHLKIKLGQFEFEASGSEEQVQQQFNQFAKLVESQKPNAGAGGGNGTGETKLEAGKTSGRLARLFTASGEKLILSVKPKTAPDGLLVLLLGYKEVKEIEPVPVTALLQGLKLSGFTVERMDEVTPTLTPQNAEMINKTGKRNASKYRLTAIGAQRAAQLSQELLDTLA